MKRFLILGLACLAYGKHFNPKDYDEVIDVQADSQEDEDKLDPLTRPPKCFGIALADAVDIGPFQAGALIGLLKNG